MLEIFAVLLSAACVALTIRKSIWCWIFSILGSIAYAIIFFDIKLYADFGLQIIFIIQSIAGWIYWRQNSNWNNPTVLTNKLRFLFALIFILSWATCYVLLSEFTDSNSIVVDSFVSVGSLMATWLLVKQKIESWVLWITVDFVYIQLFIYKGLYISSLLYLLFFILSIIGLKQWKKNIKAV